MNFAHPLFLLLWIPLAILAGVREIWSPRAVARMPYPDGRIPSQLPGTWRTQFARAPRLLIYAGLALAIVALARPRSVVPGEATHVQGIDIMILLDTSGSMRALDFNPKDRMAVALQATRSFITKRRFDRIGLMVFAGVPLLQCPLTLDYAALLEFLDQVQVGITTTENTAIGTAIAAAANRMKRGTAKSKVIILVTDGRSNSGEVDPLTAAKAAAAIGIKIYAVGVGIRGTSSIPVDTPFGKQLVPIAEDLDEPGLQDIAHTTEGGRYYRATSAKEFEQIFAEIDGLEKSDVEAPRLFDYEDKYLRWLLLGMVLLSVGLGLEMLVWRSLP
jgi:Ca-activated chloride channel family protein